MATLLAEIYGPDAETRRAVAARVEEAFRSADFIVDIDNSWGQPAERARVKISTDNLEFFKVQEQDVFDTIGILNTGQTVGYSHRGGGRTPIAIRLERPRSERLVDEAFLSTPIPANVLPGDRSIVELGDVVDVSEERAPFRCSATMAGQRRWSWPSWPVPTKRRSTACSPSRKRSTRWTGPGLKSR
jgi:multidrug efflux pump subunit AcrB